MRQVVLDTETTGLDVEQGHRIIEIGCLELVNRRRTGRTLHHYLQPDREIDAGASEVHGITNDMLTGKPRFADIAAELLEFVRGAELVIHNADFDLGFLNAELTLAGIRESLAASCPIVDTLALGRQLHPGQRNSLEALCRRYRVDDSNRAFHGALLDAELLADVYLAMTGGQATLLLEEGARAQAGAGATLQAFDRSALRFAVIPVTPEELADHEAYLAMLDRESSGRTVWRLAGESTR